MADLVTQVFLILNDQSSVEASDISTELLPSLSLAHDFLRQCGEMYHSWLGDSCLLSGQFLQEQPPSIPSALPHGLGDRSIPKGFRLCVAQLASAIAASEHHEHIMGTTSRVSIAGFCTGMLPAIAVACSRNISELMSLAFAMAHISLLLEVEMIAKARAISSGAGSWAVLFRNVDHSSLTRAVCDFNRQMGMSPSSKCYISASGQSLATVSGPPEYLTQLLQSLEQPFQGCWTRLDITAPYHAPHLSDGVILDSPLPAALTSRVMRPNVELVSTSSVMAYKNRNVSELLEIVLTDITAATLNLEHPRTWLKANLAISGTTKALILGPGATYRPIIDAVSWPILKDQACFTTNDYFHTDRSDDVYAIVGMAGRYPGANTSDELWEILLNGKTMHQTIPRDRFDISTHVDPEGRVPNSSLTKYGAFIQRPGLFDNSFFNISPAEALQLDPMHRLLLVTCYEALQDAGYQPNRTPSTTSSRIGTFFGCSADDWKQTNAAQDIGPHYIPCGIRCFATGRLNYFFNWEGPSYSIDTACSGSAASLQLALNSIKSGDCDMAVFGGSSISTCSDMFAGLSRGGFLSPTGGCKTFLEAADGYCKADAVVSLVLKRLSDAEKDNDRVLAVVRSCATSHSAQATSLTRPHAPTQERLFRRVISEAGYVPAQIDFVEMHGTGTQAGDLGEATAVSSVFLNDPRRQSNLYAGGIKPNVGHSEAASGATSLVKAILMLRNGVVPPVVTNGLKFNPRFPTGFHDLLNTTAQALAADDTEKSGSAILVNDFNAAGGCTSTVLSSPSKPATKVADPRDHHVITVSAHTKTSLYNNIERLRSWLGSHPDARVCDVAYTTTVRRMHHGWRHAFTVKSCAELTEALRTCPPHDMQGTPNAVRDRDVCFAFSGQGSSGVQQMSLYKTNSSYRTRIKRIDMVCRNLGFASILLAFDQNLQVPQASDRSLEQVHLAHLAHQCALYDMLSFFGVSPKLLCGHSLGEYAAFYAAGAVSINTAVFIIGSRSRLLQRSIQAGTHFMTMIRCSMAKLEQLTSNILQCCDISCVNGPSSVVLSGPTQTVHCVEQQLLAHGIALQRLNLPYAYHSSQMDVIMQDMLRLLQNEQFAPLQIPIASSVTGKILFKGEKVDGSYFVDHLRKTVLFEDAISSAERYLDSPVDWLELGTGSSCTSMIRSISMTKGSSFIASLSSYQSAWKSLSVALSTLYCKGHSIAWARLHAEYEMKCLRFVELPTYSFDERNYWLPYKGDWMLRKHRTAADSPVSEARSDVSCKTESVVESELKVQIRFTILPSCWRTSSDESIHKLYTHHQSLVTLLDWISMALKQVESHAERSLTHPGISMNSMAIPEAHPSVVLGSDHDIIATLEKASSTVDVTVVRKSDKRSIASVSVAPSAVTNGGRSRQEFYTKIASYKDEMTHANSRKLNHLTNNMIDRLLSSRSGVHMSFDCVESLIVDDGRLEAVAEVSTGLQGFPEQLDSSFQSQLVSCVLDAVLCTTLACIREEMASGVRIAGWETLVVPRPVCTKGRYHVYVRMAPVRTPRNAFSSDAYVFNEVDELSIVLEGIDIALSANDRIKTSVADSIVTPWPSAKVLDQRIYGSAHLDPDMRAVCGNENPRSPGAGYGPPDKQTGDLTSASTEVDSSAPPAEIITAVVAEELGLPRNSLSRDLRLMEIGMDSITGMTTSKRLAMLGISLERDFFAVHETLGDLLDSLMTRPKST